MNEFLKKSVKLFAITGLVIIVFAIINKLSMARGKYLSTKEFVCDIRDELIENPDFIQNRSSGLLKKCHDLISFDRTFVKINSEGDTFSYVHGEKRKIHRISGIINADSARVIDFMFDEIESSPEWNNQANEAKRICQSDENTDIVYQSSNPLGNGLVSPRDFLFLRRKGQYESYNILAATSVKLKKIPERKNYIRADDDITCFATRNIDGSADKCEYIWMLDIDMKGWIPQTIIDLTASIGTSEYMSAFKLKMEKIKN